MAAQRGRIVGRSHGVSGAGKGRRPELARQYDCVAVLLPGAFYVLREQQLPPLSALREHGVALALASDSNPGSSPLHSLLLTMNMACTLFRMTPAEALRGITMNAARALGSSAGAYRFAGNRQAG